MKILFLKDHLENESVQGQFFFTASIHEMTSLQRVPRIPFQ